MAQLRAPVLYVLLTVGGLLTGVGVIYGLFHDSDKYTTEKYKGNRYENSYAVFNDAALTGKQKQAIETLKSKGVEWAHFRFIEAIKSDDMVMVNAFIDAGMLLNSNRVLLEVALGSSANKKEMLSLLKESYQVSFNDLYHLPNYVSEFDEQLGAISAPYRHEKEEEHRLAMNAYKVAMLKWATSLEAQKKKMLSACTNDACRSGRINDVRRMYRETKPKEPTLNYLTNERVYLSLLTMFTWKKDLDLIAFMQQEGAELIPNKLFLTDAKLIYFTVNSFGESLIISTKQQ